MTNGQSGLAALMPDGRTLLYLAPLSILAAAIAGGLAVALRRRGVAVPYTRKVFHFVIFSLAAGVHAWRGAAGVVTFGAVVTAFVLYAVARRNKLFDALARPTDVPRERWFVVAPLCSTAAGGLLSNVLFGPFAMVGYLVAGWGDAIAEPVGTRWGRHRYRVPSMYGIPALRSFEGTAAVLVAGAAAAVIGLRVLGVPLPVAMWVGVVIAVPSAIVEAVSTHGLDNLTVQLAASGTAAWLVSLLGVPIS